MLDIGKYNKNQKLFGKYVKEVYEEYSEGITLPPEYASFVKNNLLRFLIRLSRYKFAAKMLKRTDTLLEIGCGSGLGSIFFGQFCRKVTGIDVKTTEIEEAKSINKRDNVDFAVQDFFEFPSNKKYDAIAALDVIEHMSVKDGNKLIRHTLRHLYGNGMLIIGTPSIYSYPYQGKLSQVSHVKCYDQEELVNLVEQYFGRVLAFSMNDEVVHTGYPKMAWYYFIIAFYPKNK